MLDYQIQQIEHNNSADTDTQKVGIEFFDASSSINIRF